MANLESLVSAQQSLIVSQNEKLKAQDKKIDDLVAMWNDGPDAASRKRKLDVDDDDEEEESRPRCSKRMKKVAA